MNQYISESATSCVTQGFTLSISESSGIITSSSKHSVSSSGTDSCVFPLAVRIFSLSNRHIVIRDTRQGLFKTRWENLPQPEEPAYLIDRLIPMGALSIMVAPPGVGKTEVALRLAHCVANGEEFNGRTARQGKVLYLDYEMGMTQLQRYGNRLGLKGHITPLCDVALEEVIETIEVAAEEGCTFVVIDSLSSLGNQMGSEIGINSNHNVEKILKPLTDAAHHMGIAVLLLHHTNKTERQYDGSQRVKGLSDMMLNLSLSRKRQQIELYSEKSRFEFEPLSWDAPNHPLLGNIEKEEQGDSRVDKEMTWVLDQLNLSDASLDDLAASYEAAFNKSSKTLERVLNAGIESGLIKKTKVGRKNIYSLVKKLESMI